MTGTTPQRPEDLEVAAPGEQEQQPAPMIIAEGLDFGTGDLRLFGRLDFAVPADSLAVVIGPAGSGKSVLLAALVGRFAGFRGRLEVAGLDAHKQSRRLRKITAAARIGTFVDLEPKHSISNALAERAAIEGLRLDEATEAYAQLAEALDLDLDPGRLIDDLDGYQRSALTIVLSMLRPSKVLVLDDIHRNLNTDDQRRLLTELADLAARTSTTIVVSTIETTTIPTTTIPYGAVRITLPNPGSTRTTSSR